MLFFAQKKFRVLRTRSTVRQTAAYNGECVCRRHCCATDDGTACMARTSSRADRGHVTPASFRVRTASVFQTNGSVTGTTTAEICLMNRPTVVCFFLFHINGKRQITHWLLGSLTAAHITNSSGSGRATPVPMALSRCRESEHTLQPCSYRSTHLRGR